MPGTTDTAPRYARAAGGLLLLAGGLLYLSFGYTEMAGSDLWWHLAAGREILQARTLWPVDRWSYTAFGHDWLNHEWLSDVVFYSWTRLFGETSLVYWKWAVIVATFLLLQRVLLRSTGSPLAAYLGAALAAATAAPFLDIRPHLYSLLAYALLLWLALQRRPPLWALALLFLVWVNLHGGFFFGLMALGVLLFPWRAFRWTALRSALLIGTVCLLAATLNPSGVGTFLYPLKYAFDQSSPFRELADRQPPWKPGGIISPLFFYCQWAPLAAIAYALPAVRRHTGVPWEGIVLTGLTLAMALTSRRFIPLFAMSLALLLAPLVALALRRIEGRALALGLALAALVVAGARLLPYPLAAAPAFHYLTAAYSYPVDIVNLMQANDLRGKVFAYYNWGGYLHWRTDGALRVFIDGRADTVYDADTYNAYVRILRGAPGWTDEIEAGAPDFILWPHARNDGHQKLTQLLATDRWRAVYRDGEGWLLARADMALPQSLRESADTPWRDAGIARITALGGDTARAIHYGERARAQMPWHFTACQALSQAHFLQGAKAAAKAVIADCQRYFPSRYLR